MFEKFKAFFSGLSAKLHAFFNSKGGQVVKGAISGLIEELGPIVADLLIEIATAAVVEAEKKSSVLDGDGKYAEAENTLRESLNATGTKVLKRQMNLAIELAVANLSAPPTE